MSPYAGENGLPSRIAALVRGPQSLREDIADEIADHLACHEEDEPAADPAAAHAAAVRAFGNAEQVARELRAIHLGDLIMFQKITIAALVVIVAGMAATAYFSYQSSRQTAAQFAQTAEKFDEMNQQLTELVELQRSALFKEKAPPSAPTLAPPSAPSVVRLRIRCGIAPNDEPAAGWGVELTQLPAGSPLKNPSTMFYTTDADGWTTASLTSGYTHSLVCTEPKRDNNDAAFRATYITSLRPRGDTSGTSEMRITVSSREQHQLLVRWPDGISWDSSVMNKARVRFVQVWNQPRPGQAPTTRAATPGSDEGNSRFLSGAQTIDLFKPNMVTGLLPGKVEVWFTFPGVHQELDPVSQRPLEKTKEITPAWHKAAEITTPERDGVIEIPLGLKSEQMISGILYDGTRDKPLANTGLRIVLPTRSVFTGTPGESGPYRGGLCQHQVLRTDARGRFNTWAIWPVANPALPALPPLPGGPHPASPSGDQSPPFVRIGMRCLAPASRDKQMVWFTPGPPLRVFPLADGSTFLELDASQIGTARVSLSDVEGLKASGRSVNEPLRLQPRRYEERGMKEIIEWQRTLTCNPNATIDIALPTGKYSLSAGLSVIAPGPGPDIERYCRYTRNMDVDIKAGEISRIALPIGNQSDWEMKHSESHRVGETQPATAPADQASTVGP